MQDFVCKIKKIPGLTPPNPHGGTGRPPPCTHPITAFGRVVNHGGTGGMVPQSFEWGDGVSYIPHKFDLLGITLLTEISELDMRVAAMKSTQST